MSERKLAHIEVIADLAPIVGADLIEVATVLGWECVVAKKDNFKVGDKVIYIEIDSVVPSTSQFEFLKDRNYRIRTIKLKGQVSQGLVIPIPTDWKFIPSTGDDVSERLGIIKYLTKSEIEADRKELIESNRLKKFLMRYSWIRSIFLSRKQKEGFPYWVSKTDEERIQNIPKVLEQFKDEEVYITEKINYQSGTWTSKVVPKYTGLLGKLLPIKETKFVVCSRNLTTNDKNSLYWKIATKYNLEAICKEYPGIIIQGEQGDTKVQGNKYGITEPTMWVFNIIDHEKNYHYNYDEMWQFCYDNNLQCVPQVYDMKATPANPKPKLSKLGTTVQELVEFSKGKSVLNPNVEREGVVIRCIKDGKKILSFKAINPDFLLKYND